MAQAGLTELWTARIKEYRSSGERVSVWCERHAVSTRQFYYWMRKLKMAEPQRQRASHSGWVSVLMSETDESSAEVVPLIVRIGPASIEVRSGFEPSLLAEVVRTLKAIC